MKNLSLIKGEILDRFSDKYIERFNQNPTREELNAIIEMEIVSNENGFRINYNSPSPAFEAVLEDTIADSIDILIEGELRLEDDTSRIYDQE